VKEEREAPCYITVGVIYMLARGVGEWVETKQFTVFTAAHRPK